MGFTPSIHLHFATGFASDIAMQLERAEALTGRRQWYPSYYTEALLALNGFRVEEADLGPDCTSVIDFGRNIVFLSRPCRKDHRFWKLARAIATIRLKDKLGQLDAAAAIRVADLYARHLVLPAPRVQHYIAGQRADLIGSPLIRAVALEFTVPIYVVSARMRELRERAA
ncbi:MAG: hypothetical protein J0I12_27940 [Candidatus Eremiobacteraeota bacterium]|nr:hypothetical protein [Candidatus Eremiobacteraeota bacterium]